MKPQRILTPLWLGPSIVASVPSARCSPAACRPAMYSTCYPTHAILHRNGSRLCIGPRYHLYGVDLQNQINLETMQPLSATPSFRYMVCPWHISVLHPIHQSTHEIPLSSPTSALSFLSFARLTLADAAGGRKQPESYARTQPRGSDTWSLLLVSRRVRRSLRISTD